MQATETVNVNISMEQNKKGYLSTILIHKQKIIMISLYEIIAIMDHNL